ncbi:MAG TPA: protein kinase [Vicinamibacteria bacterium]|nr:protein kinase [Vicinamibacteria bacterium]
MGLLFSLLDNPYVPWILGLGALVVAYRFLADRVRVRVPGLSVSREDLLAKVLGSGFSEKKLSREVARLKKQGNHLAAGKLLEDAGRLAEAAEAYLEGQEHWAAASTFEKLGRAERAAELYLQAGDHKKGAALFTSAGKPARAAALFLDKGNNLEAARLYALAGQWGTAAELYEKSGYPLRAAEAWEKDGKPLKAAENYEKHFMENVSFSTTYSSTAAAPDNKSAAQAGRLYEEAGQLERAVTAYSKGGYHREAAEALLRLGQPAEAAELFLRAEDHEKAADAFEKAGDPVRGATLRGEQALKSDRPAEAAAWFVKGRDYLRAAEIYESVGMMAEAASAYEGGESWAAAGGVYIRAGLGARAAAAYEKAGELETAASIYQTLGDVARAAELYGRAGHSFRSGEALARSGEREKAIALLQRVPSGDENHRAATELLAQLFIETGRPALAIERVRKAVGGEAVSAANLDLCYWMALAHEAAGERDEALALFKKMQAEDLQFRDVNERAARLARGEAPAPPPALSVAAASAAPTDASAPAPAPAASAPAPAPAPAAARVPRFVPKEEIGRGPLGVVWRGEDAGDGRGVAMRMLPNALFAPPGLLAAVAADLKAAFGLSHPNLVKVIAFMDWRGERCLVTELVAGRNFAEAIAIGRRLGFQQVHALGRIVAQVLGLVHEKGLVHGSVQPSNVVVASGVIKLADLGLGRLARTVPASTSYHAPEGGLSAADDLYALSAVMYQLLTGTHPRSQPQGVGLPLPSQLAPGVPEAMDKLLLRGLHPRPELRLGRADDLLRELREMVKIG